MATLEMLELELKRLKSHVDNNIHFVPQAEITAFNNNFAALYTKNALSMFKIVITVEEIMAMLKGYKVYLDELTKRNAFNMLKAFDMIKEKALTKDELDETFIKDVHQTLMSGIIDGGLYRNVDISVRGSRHTPPSYLKVYDRMGRFYYDLEHFTGTDLEKAAFAHLQFAKIHPFLDGNVRMSSLILNYQLIALGYFPISIPPKMQNTYLSSLESYKVDKDSKPFQLILTELLIKEYQRVDELINHYQIA